MNSTIMSLPNELVYNHQLRCGNYDVASARLSVPLIGSAQLGQWVHQCLDPERSVVFVDTDEVCVSDGKIYDD